MKQGVPCGAARIIYREQPGITARSNRILLTQMNVVSTTRFDCAEVRNLADAYADHELPVETYRGVREHVSRCWDCKDLIQDKILLKGRIRSAVKALAVPASLGRDLRSLIARNPI